MKKVLIISPYFPPSNAADMQRIRMSLPYFKELGWEAEVVCVDPQHSEIVKDELLKESIPKDIKIHQVQALSKKWTSKLGLGSLALRSLWFYKRCVDQLLNKEHFDLIYFSTTQFPIMILGAHWKKKFGIPYVIDMQDPWHSEYYQDKPKHERPAKYWFSYRLNKYLEPIAMKQVDGLIAVSKDYIDTLKDRYAVLENIPSSVITFGAFKRDFEIAKQHQQHLNTAFKKEKEYKYIIYVGRGGHDMQDAIRLLFNNFKKGLNNNPELYQSLRFLFIGTSYAKNGEGITTIEPIAKEIGIKKYVTELTDRIPFYQTIYTLQQADALVVPGSNDPQYTASKLYPYILAEKPLLGIFHPHSNAYAMIKNTNAGWVASISNKEEQLISNFLSLLASDKWQHIPLNKEVFENYSAQSMTEKQCELFNSVIG
jgi:hypothetical protein